MTRPLLVLVVAMLVAVLGAPAGALAGASAPFWSSSVPKEAGVLYVVGVSDPVTEPAAARVDAVRDALSKVAATVGFEPTPEDAVAKKDFSRRFVDQLGSGKPEGPRIEREETQELQGGAVKHFVLVRIPKPYLARAKAELAGARPKRFTLGDVGKAVATGVRRVGDDQPLFEKIAVRGFHERSSGKPMGAGLDLQREIANAVGRMNAPGINLDASNASPLAVSGEFRLHPGGRHLLVTASLVDHGRNRVLWTSEEFRVTEGDFSELLPPTPPPPPVVVAPAPAPVATPRAPKAARTRNPGKELSANQKVGKPRIMVILPEVHLSRKAPDPAGETELIRLLLEGGFKVVDQGQSKKIRENEQLSMQLRGDSERVAELGREHGADIVIIGEAFSETSEHVALGFRVQARVEARAVRCDTGEILVAHGLEAETTDASEMVSSKKALRMAGTKVAQYFVGQLATRWTAEATGSRSLEVLISNVSYAQVARLRETLRTQVDGVDEVFQRSYAENLARFEVDFAGDPHDLVDEMIQQKYGDFELDLVRVSANKVEFRRR